MGIRSIERRLAAELCYEAVTRVVREYLEACRSAGRYLPHYEHLMVPIIRAGYYPPGLLGVGDFISRQEQTARAAAKRAGVEGREISLVDEDSLIEELMWPYPTARLRARRHREAQKQFAEAQRGQWARDATKRNTMQQNATVSASAPSETEDGRGADQTSRANANGDDPDPLTAREQWRRENATKCDTLQQNATVSASATSETEDGRGAEQRPSLREMQHIATERNESSTATVTSAATSPRAAAAANQQKGAPAALKELERWERKRA